MALWTSVHPPTSAKILSGFVFGATTVAVTIVTALLLWDKEVPGAVVLACYCVTLPSALISLRRARSGVYVGGHGVRVRFVVGTRTLRWAELHAVTSRPDGLRQLRTHREVLWIEPLRGAAFATPVRCNAQASRREREVYDGAVDHLRAQLAGARAPRSHEVIPPATVG